MTPETRHTDKMRRKRTKEIKRKDGWNEKTDEKGSGKGERE